MASRGDEGPPPVEGEDARAEEAASEGAPAPGTGAFGPTEAWPYAFGTRTPSSGDPFSRQEHPQAPPPAPFAARPVVTEPSPFEARPRPAPAETAPPQQVPTVEAQPALSAAEARPAGAPPAPTEDGPAARPVVTEPAPFAARPPVAEPRPAPTETTPPHRVPTVEATPPRVFRPWPTVEPGATQTMPASGHGPGEPVAPTRPTTSFDAWRGGDGYAPPPDSSVLPRFGDTAAPSSVAPASETPAARIAAGLAARLTLPRPATATWAQALLLAGLLLSLLLAVYPALQRARAAGADAELASAHAFIEEQIEKALKVREEADEKALATYEVELGSKPAYERRELLDQERERRAKSRREQGDGLREQLAGEVGLKDLQKARISAVAAPRTLTGPLLVVLVAALVALVVGSLAAALRATGLGRVAYVAVLLVGLSSAGVGLAGTGPLPATEAGTLGARPQRPLPGPPTAHDSRAICDRLFDLAVRDLGSSMEKERFRQGCEREMARATPARRACYAGATSMDDIMACEKVDKDKD